MGGMKLFPFERRWAEIVARSIVPRSALGGAVGDVDAGALFAHDLAVSPWMSALALRLALWLVWLSPLPRRTFGSLTPEEREARLEKLLDSRSDTVRMLMMFLKLIFVSLVLGDLRALKHLGAYHLRLSP
jgi:hypothetical protein